MRWLTNLIGNAATTGDKILLTLAVIGAITISRVIIVVAVTSVRRESQNRASFWTHQIINLAALVAVIAGVMLIWFDDPSRLGTGLGFVSAGLAIAAQRAVTAFAGYLVILTGKSYKVGDRIKMGPVQGDVIALGFLQTRILEMGQPANVNAQEPPGMWVRARQYSGRIVTVTNDKVFDEAVYNFTREFPFLWDELTIPIPYSGNHERAEQILLDAAREATMEFVEQARAPRERLEQHYAIELDHLEPRAYWGLTDNWLEVNVRFLCAEHGVLGVKDRMARHILREFQAAGIEVASGTYEIVGVPPIRIQQEPPHPEPK